MFKIICDVGFKDMTKQVLKSLGINIPLSSVKHNQLITYHNCEACDIDNFMLTSTGDVPSESEIYSLINLWNRQVLNPINPQYDEAYKNILAVHSANKLDKDRFKYISLFEKDNGLNQQVRPPVFIHVFDTIIDTTEEQTPALMALRPHEYRTGYKKYHSKYIIIYVTNATQETFITFGALEPKRPTGYAIRQSLVDYSLRHKGALDCKPMEYEAKSITGWVAYNGGIYSRPGYEYIKFLEKDFIEMLDITLAQFRLCKVDDTMLVLIDKDVKTNYSNIDTIKNLCANKGGHLQSMREVIEFMCENRQPNHKISGNDLFAVTCNNYHSLLHFDSDGEISSGEFTTLVLGRQHQEHNEL